ncbi:MAG: preprotein translocase subunit SecE [Gaiellaceae bacterium]
MARETRGQRRARREAAGKTSGESPKSANAKAAPSKASASKPGAPRARQRQAQVRPGMQPASTQTGSRRDRRQRGTFVKECWAELKKVEWPNRGQVIQGTIVVIIACVIVGIFLYGADQALRPFVRNVLLGQ